MRAKNSGKSNNCYVKLCVRTGFPVSRQPKCCQRQVRFQLKIDLNFLRTVDHPSQATINLMAINIYGNVHMKAHKRLYQFKIIVYYFIPTINLY